MTRKPYIVVRREAGRLVPSHKPFEHHSFAAAVTEAERLTRANPGSEFVVFEARTRSFYSTVETETL